MLFHKHHPIKICIVVEKGMQKLKVKQDKSIFVSFIFKAFGLMPSCEVQTQQL